jgi:hypothetical protein
MELKNFFAQDLSGNVIAIPTVYLYAPSTTTPATGLQDKNGAPLTNPFTGTANGFIQFAAPDGDYDLRVTGAGRDFTMRVRFLDAGASAVQVLREDLEQPGGAALVGANDHQTQADVNAERVSVKRFGAVGDGVTDETAAFLLAEAAADEIYLPDGWYLVSSGTTLTKRYWGPGRLIYSGIGPVAFAGPGLNDASFTGSFVQPRELQVKVRVNAVNQTGISGAPSPCDTYEYSLNGGATWIGTYDAYNPGDDQVYALPLGLNANIGYTGTSVKVGIPGTGVVPVFAANTGHTIGATWSLTLSPNPHGIETQSGYITKNGAIIGGVGGLGDNSVFLGRGVLGNQNNAGNQLVAIGSEALYSNTSGYANTAVGITALRSNTRGFNNTAVGPNALYSNTTGINNTAVGIYAGNSNTTGEGNTSFGSDSNGYCSDGTGNTACGIQSLYHNNHGSENTAVGRYALRGGIESLNNGTSQTYCTAVGAFSLYKGGGTFNVALGHQAGSKNTGNWNTYIGAESGAVATEISGGYNVFVGYRAGTSAAQANSVNNCIAIGDNSYTTGTNAIAIGAGVFAPANAIVLGNSGHANIYHFGNISPQFDNSFGIGGPTARYTNVYAASGVVSTSDAREKQQTRTLSDAEQAVAKRLKSLIRAFKFNDAVSEKGTGARIHVGVIAQDVKAAFEAEGLVAEKYAVLCYDEWASELDANGSVIRPAGNRYGIRYEELLSFIVAAL